MKNFGIVNCFNIVVERQMSITLKDSQPQVFYCVSTILMYVTRNPQVMPRRYGVCQIILRNFNVF